MIYMKNHSFQYTGPENEEVDTCPRYVNYQTTSRDKRYCIHTVL
jgi:hypothetical protein